MDKLLPTHHSLPLSPPQEPLTVPIHTSPFQPPGLKGAKSWLIVWLCQAEESLMAHSLPCQAWRSAGASAAQSPSSTWGIPSRSPASSTGTAATWARRHRSCGSWEQSFYLGGGSSSCQGGPRNPPSPCPTSMTLGPFSPAVCSGVTAYRSWTRLSCRQAVSPCSHPPTPPPMLTRAIPP